MGPNVYNCMAHLVWDQQLLRNTEDSLQWQLQPPDSHLTVPVVSLFKKNILSKVSSQVSMNPRPNIISYQVCIEDGGGKRGELAGGSGTTKYYQYWKFGDGRMRHLALGAT